MVCHEGQSFPELYSRQDDQSFTLFDRERLRTHFTDITDLKPFDLDVTFSANAQAWTGAWSRSGQALSLVLERQSTGGGLAPSAFVATGTASSIL